MKNIFLIILAAITVLIGVLLLKPDSNIDVQTPAVDVGSLSTSEELVYWMEEIKENGGLETYNFFKSMYADLSYERQHGHAHVFGEALYKTESIEGVAVCDSSFGFGCFHSFFGWAMIENGTSIMSELDQACVAVYGEKGLGCPHGIGHGVLAELGSEHLDQALDLCSTLTWQEPIGGCSSGVFMEYNYNTMGDGDLRLPSKNLHYPCNLVSQRFKQACYFEQTTWWAGLTEEDYSLIGNLCSDVETLPEKQACFRGVGHTVATTDSYDMERIKSVCSLMPGSESEILCIEGATWITSWQPEFKDTWKNICEGFTGVYYDRCIDSHDFI